MCSQNQASTRMNLDEMIGDLVNKYRLLCPEVIRVFETASYREIVIPLIENIGGGCMKLSRPTKAEIIGFYISMPFIELALNYILYKDRLFMTGKCGHVSVPLIFIIGLVRGICTFITITLCGDCIPN